LNKDSAPDGAPADVTAKNAPDLASKDKKKPKDESSKEVDKLAQTAIRTLLRIHGAEMKSLSAKKMIDERSRIYDDAAIMWEHLCQSKKMLDPPEQFRSVVHKMEFTAAANSLSSKSWSRLREQLNIAPGRLMPVNAGVYSPQPFVPARPGGQDHLRIRSLQAGA